MSVVIIYVMVIRLEKGIAGIWMGPVAVVTTATFAYLAIWSTIDWKELIDKAKAQRKLDKGE